MTAPYYQDESVTLWHGDALDVLRTLPAGSVDCCVTSPPYFGLRDYGVDGQMGAESSPAEYVEGMRALFAEVRRVLADDATLWLNLGDSYASNTKGSGGTGKSGLMRDGRSDAGRQTADSVNARAKFEPRRFVLDVPAKNLLGIPWRTAFALQDDGWILRNDIIWAKPNGMPESVTDRLSAKHEHLFLLSKSPRYWFDLDPIREPVAYPLVAAPSEISAHDPQSPSHPSPSSSELPQREQTSSISAMTGLYRPDPTPYPGNQCPQAGRARTGRRRTYAGSDAGRNPGDVWTIPTSPTPFAHFATMPPALAERAIQAGCKPGGIVLDPFSGSGTTGLAAAKHGRRYVGVDLNADYLADSLHNRLAQPGLDWEVTA